MNPTNICGTVDRTPTENLYNAVVGKRLTISIDMRDEPEVVRIIESAIEDVTEREMFLSGYGLAGRPRKAQNVLARENGTTPWNVSRLFRVYIEKLGEQPYRSQLDALVVTSEQAYDAVKRVTAAERELAKTDIELNSARAQLKKLAASAKRAVAPEKIQRQIAGYQAGIRQREQTIAERDQTIAELQEELARRDYELTALRKRLTDAETQLSEKTVSLTHAESELSKLQDKWTSVLNVVGAMQEAKREVEAANETILNREVSEVFDNPGLLNALERVGIHTLADLMKVKEGRFGSLGIGKPYVKVIRQKLAECGLSLKTA